MMIDWQLNLQSVEEGCSFLYLNSLMSDVVFNVGLGDSLHVVGHKLILSIASPVFHSMFYGNFKESSFKGGKEVIDVLDIEPPIFEEMLRYIYTNEVFLSETNAIPILYCSKKYMLPYLSRKVLFFLSSILSSSNAFSLMSKTRIYGFPDFQDKCWSLISIQINDALSSPSFTDIDYTTLLIGLSSDIQNRSEVKAFNSLLNWGRAIINTQLNEKKEQSLENRMRELLRIPLKQIEFHKMKASEFANTVMPSGLLNSEEMNEIFLAIALKEAKAAQTVQATIKTDTVPKAQPTLAKTSHQKYY